LPAVAVSVLGLALMMLALLYFQLPRVLGVGLSLLIPFLLGSLFGFWRAGASILLGLAVSSAFCFYFGVVFIALLYNAEKDWLVAFLAVGTLATGWLGALAGGHAAQASGRHHR
jgi:hypothetical protein